MKNVLVLVLIITTYDPGWTQILDESYDYKEEKIIKNVFMVPASVGEIWAVYNNNEGFESWAAPVAEIEWKRGGTIKSSFTVSGKIGDPTTTTSHIVNYIPMKEIVIRDELLPLLEIGIEAGWLQDIPEEFLNDLRENGSDIFTTIHFEKIRDNETRITVYNTGYKSGGYWDAMYQNAVNSNKWTYQKLIERFKSGPIDWSKTK